MRDLTDILNKLKHCYSRGLTRSESNRETLRRSINGTLVERLGSQKQHSASRTLPRVFIPDVIASKKQQREIFVYKRLASHGCVVRRWCNEFFGLALRPYREDQQEYLLCGDEDNPSACSPKSRLQTAVQYHMKIN